MYEYYSLHCKALSNGRYCGKIFGLPGSTLLPEEEYENRPSQPKWPSAEWKAHVACPLCGCIREYGFADMDWWHDEERLVGDLFLHVKMECSKSDCRVPVVFYIVDFDVIAHGDDGESFDLPHHREKWIAETDWVKLIRSGKFHGVCKKGMNCNPYLRSVISYLRDRASFRRNMTCWDGGEWSPDRGTELYALFRGNQHEQDVRWIIQRDVR